MINASCVMLSYIIKGYCWVIFFSALISKATVMYIYKGAQLQ